MIDRITTCKTLAIADPRKEEARPEAKLEATSEETDTVKSQNTSVYIHKHIRMLMVQLLPLLPLLCFGSVVFSTARFLSTLHLLSAVVIAVAVDVAVVVVSIALPVVASVLTLVFAVVTQFRYCCCSLIKPLFLTVGGADGKIKIATERLQEKENTHFEEGRVARRECEHTT